MIMVCLCTADASGAATVSSTPVTSKKKKEDKETAKAAVRARYLMEKYGMKWRSKVIHGVCGSVLSCSFHKAVK